MNWNKWIRQSHRWMSIAFTVTVIANFVALAKGGGLYRPETSFTPVRGHG
jgi:cellulose synthase/poly-beta-1,6-N-acetylglucosamine synthase-like glycosyltransferase